MNRVILGIWLFLLLATLGMDTPLAGNITDPYYFSRMPSVPDGSTAFVGTTVSLEALLSGRSSRSMVLY